MADEVSEGSTDIVHYLRIQLLPYDTADVIGLDYR
jgi:hypothetical protein